MAFPYSITRQVTWQEMWKMPKTIISDTSCFILLSNIGELELLQRLYGQVTTTLEVAIEFGEPLPDWVEIKVPNNIARQKQLELQVDKGEASAIALALETPDCTIILDDWKAWRAAEKLGLDITGTIGVIIKAKNQGLVISIKPFLAKIKTTNFRLTEELEIEALKEAGESETWKILKRSSPTFNTDDYTIDIH